MINLVDKFNNLLTDEIKSKFEIYYEFLTQENKKYNLTAITEKDQVYVKHFADSIAAEDILYGSVLDVGAGAGFPSVPLKIVKPDLDITMADSLNKRVNFLKELIEKLNLKKCRAIHIRAEDIKEKESYDFAIARAVAPLVTLSEYLLPFVKLGGKMIAYKSESVESEISAAEKAIKVLGGKVSEVKVFELDEQTLRKLVIIEKVAQTPPKYPRSGNKPRSAPIV